jgi:hypothetical protein
LRNIANYNGDKYSLQAEVQGDSLVGEVNGKRYQLPADSWATSYWRNPWPGDMQPRTVVLFDSDKGQKLNGELRFVGAEPMKVGNENKQTLHYRITGDVKVDMWFDETNRMVRSESMEMGQKTVAELVKIVN